MNTENEIAQDNLKAEIATKILLISFAMLFATLFLGYAIFRGNSEVWPPMGINRPDMTVPISSLVICAISSLLLMFSSRAQLFKQEIMARTFFSMAHVFAYFFAGSQITLWKNMAKQGLLLSSGSIFTSMLYGFTWIHAGHVFLALLMLAYCQWQFFQGSDAIFKNRNVIKAAYTFWHFLFVIWVLMFLLLFYL